jgi:hypothetical protein
MKKFIFSLLMVSSVSSFAATLNCSFEKVYQAKFTYDGKGGKLSGFKGKDKLFECRVKFQDDLKSKFDVTGASRAEIREFKINDCVNFNDALKNEVIVGDSGFVKIHSPKESYLHFSENHNSARCSNGK